MNSCSALPLNDNILFVNGYKHNIDKYEIAHSVFPQIPEISDSQINFDTK